MLGGRRDWVPNPAEMLAASSRTEDVGVGSSRSIPTVRFASSTPWRCSLVGGRSIDVVVVMIYSGPAFVVAMLTVGFARLLGLPVVLHLHGGNLPVARTTPTSDRSPGLLVGCGHG